MPQNKPSNSSNKLISTGLKTLSSAVISAVVLMSGAHAAGFGKLTVLSSLGQPLRAEIELTSVSKDDEAQLVAKLASVESYQQANIDFNPALLSLQFAIDRRGARSFVRVTSPQPMNEPFVDVLMELGGTKTRVIREYTILLDPADLRSTQSAQITAPVRAPSVGSAMSSAAPTSDATGSLSAARNDRSAPAVATEKPARAERAARRAAKAPEVAAAKNDGGYRVKNGDTLIHIAGDNLPSGVSLDQMLVAMYRSNENAFVDKNINRLRSGEILSIPDADTARSITRDDAKNVILAQSKDFKGYRNTLASQVATAAPREAADAKQSGGGKITTKVEEQANPANDAKDKLKLTRAGGAVAKAGAQPVAATEEQIALEKATAEAEARIKELEKNVNDLQKVLEVKSKHLDELQKEANGIGKTPTAPEVSTSAASVAAAATAATAAPTPTQPAPIAAVPAPDAGAKAVEGQSAAVASTPPAAAVASADAAPPVVPKVKPVIKPVIAPKVAAPAPASEPGFFSSLTDNPLLLPAGGVLALLLAGLGIYRVRRSRQQHAFLESGGVPMTNSGLKTNSLFGSTGGQSVDTKNSIFNSSFVPSVSNLDTNVDPVAEADVYIAYGRDAQAEEILKEALRSQPARNAIRVKLLEIYATRKDARAFEILASELYSLTNGDGDDWQQAAALGLTVDPANPLYGGGQLTEQVVAKAASITAPTQPLDGLDFNALHAVTQPHKPQDNASEDDEPETMQLFAPLSIDELAHKEVAPTGGKVVHDLDFDFEGGDSHSLENSDTILNTIMLVPTPESAKSMLDSLDFELGHKGQSNKAPTVVLPTDAVQAAAPVAPDVSPTAFSNDVEFPHKYAPLDLKGDTPVESVPELKTPIPAPTVGPTVAMATPLEFDMSGMDLDLGGVADKHTSSQAESANKHGAVTNAEMATKLDLAVAYQEIGDSEGARELLEEVLKGGDVDQVASAKTLLAKLA